MTSEEMRNVFNEGFEQLIMPQFVKVYESLDRIEGTLDDHSIRLDRMERILMSSVDRLDEHSIEIKRIKKHIGMK